MAAGAKKRVPLGVYAVVALVRMLVGGIGVNVAPKGYLGRLERFRMFAVTGFTMVLGIYFFQGWKSNE